MKASDVKTDGTEYAYQQRAWALGRKVKVIEKTTIKGQSYSSGNQSGWLIEFLDDPGQYDRNSPKKGERRKAVSRQLVGLWSVFDAQAKADREQRLNEQEAIRVEEARQEQAKTALASLFSRYSIGEGINPQREMRFTASGLNSLLEDLVKAVTDEMF